VQPPSIKLSDLAENYLNGALQGFLTLAQKQEIFTATRRNPNFLQQYHILKSEAKDQRTIAFTVLSCARQTNKNTILN
jgi:hypothetical protein